MPDGDDDSTHELWRCLMLDLRVMARGFMRHERPDHTLQPTALVSETYCRFFAGTPPVVLNREHFLALARRMMWQVLVEHGRRVARRRTFLRELREGRQSLPVELERFLSVDRLVDPLDPEDVGLGQLALEELRRRHPERAAAFEIWLWGDPTAREVADLLGKPETTIQSWLRFDRSFLRDYVARRRGGREEGNS